MNFNNIHLKSRFIRFIIQPCCLCRCGFLSVLFCWVAQEVSFEVGSWDRGENLSNFSMARPDLASQARVVKLLRWNGCNECDGYWRGWMLMDVDGCFWTFSCWVICCNA